MNENRRFTRSYTSAFRNTQKNDEKSKEHIELELKIKKAIAALYLINSVSLQNHWTVCKRAQILFQMGRVPRSLNTVRKAMKIERDDCYQCSNLLLKIIHQSLFNLRSFAKDISFCLEFQNLPARIRQQLQSYQTQIDNQQISASSSQQSLETERLKIQQFTSYYETKGLIFKKVEIVQVQQQYRVARAKSPIKPYQIIIFVPYKQIITLQLAKSLPQLTHLQKLQPRLKSPKHCILSIFLLIHQQQGHRSPYYNYIQCLPSKLNNFPIYYSDQLLEELNGTYFLSMVKRKKVDVQEDFKEICGVLGDVGVQVEYERFVWARMVVSSRIFGVVINDKKTDALVPIADMLNHKTPKMTSWYFSDKRKGFIVQNAQQQIHKGHEIFDSYGYKCNSRFLLNYGFTIPQNTYNEVLIILKRRRGSKIVSPNIKLTVNLGSDQFRNLMAYHRRCIVEMSTRGKFQVEDVPGKGMEFISNENECESWRMIQQTMKDQLQSYKTTIKTDEKLLRSSQSLTLNMRNCIEIRLGEKKVLHFYIKMSKKMIEYFTRRRKNVDVTQYEIYLKDIRVNLVSSTQ